MHGDPFFWLNPENGKVIARNVAEGLGDVRPEWREAFLVNAREFSAKLDKDIARWTEELKPLAGLRIFSAQCGWQNFTQIGGPAFASCKKSPGVLPAPEELAKQMIDLKVEIILVDPNTPPEYGRAFRKLPHVKVVEVPSSLESFPGQQPYSSLFDNLIRSLKQAAGN